ncbi:MAG: hypothetical protein RIF33_17245 [Cyclobacteriaceae bacterium]
MKNAFFILVFFSSTVEVFSQKIDLYYRDRAGNSINVPDSSYYDIEEKPKNFILRISELDMAERYAVVDVYRLMLDQDGTSVREHFYESHKLDQFVDYGHFVEPSSPINIERMLLSDINRFLYTAGLSFSVCIVKKRQFIRVKTIEDCECQSTFVIQYEE